MRARNIKPGLFKNADLAELPLEARYLFPGLWCLADCEGRLKDEPRWIKAEIFPYDPIGAARVHELLQMLHNKGFINRYSCEGKNYIQVVSWSKHQRPHKQERAYGSHIPKCPENEAVTIVRNLFGTSSEDVRNKFGTCSELARYDLYDSNTNPSISNPDGLEISPLSTQNGTSRNGTSPDSESGGLFPDETSTDNARMVRPAVSTAKARRKKPIARPMCAEQRARFREFLDLHPKNTIQTVSAEKLWSEKVTSHEIADWLIEQLRRETAGDTTYLHGPGKWLADHLALYANGVEASAWVRSGNGFVDDVTDVVKHNVKEYGKPW